MPHDNAHPGFDGSSGHPDVRARTHSRKVFVPRFRDSQPWRIRRGKHDDWLALCKT